jgi:adenylate cyclase
MHWPRSLTLRHWRLASGAVMWCYICAHFVNHALGLVSLAAAEAALTLAAAVWQSLPGTALLYGAFTVHVTLAFVGLHQRHTLRLPPLELARIFFGLTIPLLLFGHVVSTRVAYEWYGEAAQYKRVVANLVRSGNTGWQLALLAPGWLHGCMGLHVALRHRIAYRRWHRALLVLAIVLPALAALGFWALTKEVAALPGFAIARPLPGATDAQRHLAMLQQALLIGYGGLLGLVLVLRAPRDWRRWRDGRRAAQSGAAR